MINLCVVAVYTNVNDGLMAIFCHQKTCLHAKFPMLLFNLNQFWIFAKNFHGSPQYKISLKSVQ